MAETNSGERRAAGPGDSTERITGPGTEHITGRGTEPITGHITERGTEPITGHITERGTEPISGHITAPGTAEWPERPPYTYVALITMAIRASPEQRLPLSSIYAYIAERFPFYRGPSRQWHNSIRHNLSLNPCFRRLPRRHGRAGDWELHPAFQDMFPEGNYLLRRRQGRPPASPPSGIAGTAPLPAGLWPPPPSGIPPGPAEPRPPLLPEPGPAALWPPVPAVPSGCPQGPWAALMLGPGYPELPGRGPPRYPELPLPAWLLRPAEPDTALSCDTGDTLSPAFR